MPTTLLTDIAETKITAASGSGTQVAITHIALGDGNGANYEPNYGQTALQRERARQAIQLRHIVDSNAWRVKAEFGPETIAFDVREMGFFDADGDLIAVWAGNDVVPRKTGAITYLVDHVLSFTRVDSDLIIVDAPDDKVLSVESRVFSIERGVPPSPEDYGAEPGNPEHDDHDALMDAMQAGVALASNGAIYKTSKPLDCHLVPAVQGLRVNTPVIVERHVHVAVGGETEITVPFPLYNERLRLDAVDLLPDAVPSLITSVDIDFTKRNAYNVIRDPAGHKIKLNAPLGAGQVLVINARRPGAMIQAMGDWSANAAQSEAPNALVNGVMRFCELLTDPDQVDGFHLENIGIDAAGQATTCMRGAQRNPNFRNIFLTGARSYAFQSSLIGGEVSGLEIDHAFPIQPDELDGHNAHELVWFPADVGLVAGGVTSKDNNALDQRTSDGRISKVRIDMRGNSTQSGFWQNGSRRTSYFDIAVRNGGKSGIGGEQVQNLTFVQPRVLAPEVLAANAELNNRIAFFEGQEGISKDITLIDPYTHSGGHNGGVAFSVNTHGRVIGGRAEFTGGHPSIETHGGNDLTVIGYDFTGSSQGIASTTGSFGAGVQVTACLGQGDILPRFGEIEHMLDLEGSIDAGNATQVLSEVLAGKFYDFHLVKQAGGLLHSGVIHLANGGPRVESLQEAHEPLRLVVSGTGIGLQNDHVGTVYYKLTIMKR